MWKPPCALLSPAAVPSKKTDKKSCLADGRSRCKIGDLIVNFYAEAAAYEVRIEVFYCRADITQVQRRDFFHLSITELEIPQVKVFLNAAFVGGFRDHRNTTLNVPWHGRH